jgi:hypothetical protein
MNNSVQEGNGKVKELQCPRWQDKNAKYMRKNVFSENKIKNTV